MCKETRHSQSRNDLSGVSRGGFRPGEPNKRSDRCHGFDGLKRIGLSGRRCMPIIKPDPPTTKPKPAVDRTLKARRPLMQTVFRRRSAVLQPAFLGPALLPLNALFLVERWRPLGFIATVRIPEPQRVKNPKSGVMPTHLGIARM